MSYIHGHAVGGSRSRTNNSYHNMLTRCYNPNYHSYELYGGLGVSVCARWLSGFEEFLSDMGERPAGKTLDRINPSGDYSPENCRWATYVEQRANLRNKELSQKPTAIANRKCRAKKKLQQEPMHTW